MRLADVTGESPAPRASYPVLYSALTSTAHPSQPMNTKNGYLRVPCSWNSGLLYAQTCSLLFAAPPARHNMRPRNTSLVSRFCVSNYFYPNHYRKNSKIIIASHNLSLREIATRSHSLPFPSCHSPVLHCNMMTYPDHTHSQSQST